MTHPNNGSTVLVAGAGGFIGFHVAQALAILRPEIRVVRLSRPGVAPASDQRLEWDLGDDRPGMLAEQMKRWGVAAIVNCAGTTAAVPGRGWTLNVEGTKRLAAAAALARPGMTFCQIGSAAEYQMLPRPEKTTEETPARPQGDYGRSKLEATRLLIEAAKRGDLQGYVLRFFNPLGPGMPPTQLFGRIAEYLRREDSEPLSLGPLGSYRDFIDVRDAAAGVAASLQQAGRLTGEILNVGSGVAQCTRELVKLLFAQQSGKTFRENEGTGSPRSDWANWQQADIGKMQSMLGWRPRYSAVETLRQILPASSIAATADRSRNF